MLDKCTLVHYCIFVQFRRKALGGRIETALRKVALRQVPHGAAEEPIEYELVMKGFQWQNQN
jgi:hypothetical protein